MPYVLRWSDWRDEELLRVEQAYAAQVCDALGHTLSRASDDNPAGAASALEALQQSPPASVIRIVFAPETTARLLFPRLSEKEQGPIPFLTRSFRAEDARGGTVVSVAEPTWTPLGDFGIVPPRTIVASPALDLLPPVDLGSPYALSIDPVGMQARLDRPGSPLTRTAHDQAVGLLRSAGAGIAHASPLAHRFVMRFLRSLVVLQDSRVRFGSSSRADYIGRAVIRSVDWTRVDELDCAEGIVHEAIHALLSMGMLTEPWIVDDDAGASRSRLRSPWTGNSIAFDAFVHACFVWFGLLNFWTSALARPAFPEEHVLARVRRAGRGFESADLAKTLVASHGDVLAPVVSGVIGQMQDVACDLITATR